MQGLFYIVEILRCFYPVTFTYSSKINVFAAEGTYFVSYVIVHFRIEKKIAYNNYWSHVLSIQLPIYSDKKSHFDIVFFPDHLRFPCIFTPGKLHSIQTFFLCTTLISTVNNRLYGNLSRHKDTKLTILSPSFPPPRKTLIWIPNEISPVRLLTKKVPYNRNSFVERLTVQYGGGFST